jgi:flagellum-specific peptidoglycan hydrolase FlgJ
LPVAARPLWQATALVTLGAGGIVTGLSLVPKAAPAELTSPASLPVKLLALQGADGQAPGADGMLRSAIVHVARHFLRLAQTRSPAEMEALIWQYASSDGADHGPSCAAFASLALELGSQLAGQQSWVSGGTSYPWAVHSWVDGRVDPNPASPGVVSVLRDARTHGRWHPLGDGYRPQPGDWVLFDGHVEVVTGDQGGVLHTIGGDSVPNFSVNAHEYAAPLQGQGVAGFVDNGMTGPASQPHAEHQRRPAGPPRDQARTGDLASSYGVSGAAAPAPPAFSIPAGNRGDGHRGAAPRAAHSGAAGHAAPGGRAGASGGHAPGRGGAGGAVAPGRGAAAGGGSGARGGAGARQVSAAGAGATGQPALAPRAVPVPPEAAQPRSAPVTRALAGPAEAPGSQAAQRSPGVPAPRVSLDAPATAGPPQPGPARNHSGRPSAASQQAGAGPDRDRQGRAQVPATGLRPTAPRGAPPGEAAIPGLFHKLHHHPAESAALAPYHRHDVPMQAPRLPGTAAQQAFIQQVARGAMASQRKYGVPASVTIAQAIDESGWGQSILATGDNNLFGIKGTGPAGTDVQPTQEVINGSVVSTTAPFRVYHSIAESIDAHGKLLARSGDYAAAMSVRHDPNAFAAALTGVYATDPQYGTKLIQLMRDYHLYRYDAAAGSTRAGPAGAASGAAAPARHRHGGRTARPASAAAPGPDSLSPQHAGRTPQLGGADIPGTSARPGHRGRAPRPDQPPPSTRAFGGRSHTSGPSGAPASTPSAAAAGVPGAANVPGANPAGGQPGPSVPDPVPNAAPVPFPGRTARPGHVPHPARTAPTTGSSSLADGPRSGQSPAPRPAAGGARPGQARAAGLAGPVTTQAGLAGPASPMLNTAPGMAGAADNAAIPGLPHAAAPQPKPAHPGSILRYLGPAQPPATIYRSGPTAAARQAANGQSAGPPGAVTRRAADPAQRPPEPAAASPAAGPGQAGGPGHGGGTDHATGVAGGSRIRSQPTAGTPARQGRWSAQRGTPSAHHGAPAGAAAIPGLQPDSVRAAAPAGRARPASSASGGAARSGHGARTAPATSSAGAAVPLRPAGSAASSGAARAAGSASAAAVTATTTAAVFTSGPAAGATEQASTAPVGRPSSAGASGHDAALAVYRAHLPPAVREAFLRSAKTRLTRAEPLYSDVASQTGMRWEILAACDWMQCRARHGHSPVYGEKLGALNEDGTCYRTRSAALQRAAYDLVELARSVYQLDIVTSRELSVRELANVFAAFRWGGLLRQHDTSAMDFPYSVAGLTADHMHMRWPNIDEPNAPDRPGRRFGPPFGAVPVVLSLNYHALA